MEDLIVLAISAAVGGGIAAFLYGVLHDWALNRRVRVIETSLDSLSGSIRGAKGNAAQAAVKQQRNAALMEGIAMFQGGTPPADIIKTLAAKYPELAASLLGDLKF